MDSTKCIDNQQWEAYSQKKLTRNDLELLYSHVLTCEICADIKEGIDAMHTPANLVQTVKEINEEIDAKIAPKKSRILPLFYWAAAASFVIVSGWLMVRQAHQPILTQAHQPLHTQAQQPLNTQAQDESLGQAQEAVPQDAQVQEAPPQILSQQKGKDSDNSKLLADGSYKTKAQRKSNVILEKAMVADHTEMVMDDSKPPQLALAESETKSLSAENVKEDLTKVIEPKVESKVELSEVTTVVSTKESSSKKRSKAIYPSNYANNAQSLDNNGAVEVVDSKNLIGDTLLLQKAQLYVKNKQLDSAQICLTPLLKHGPLQEDAYWLLAEIYQLENKKDDYKAALKKVIAMNGKYKKEAMVRQAHQDD